MNDGSKVSVGTFIGQQLAAKKRAVAATRNMGGYPAIYPEVARDILKQFPDLTDAQRITVFGTLKEDAELTTKRSGLPVIALGSVSRILGIPRIAASRKE
ncbi:MAG: hypothetical protein ABSE92_16175 [Terriglobales bacterium]